MFTLEIMYLLFIFWIIVQFVLLPVFLYSVRWSKYKPLNDLKNFQCLALMLKGLIGNQICLRASFQLTVKWFHFTIWTRLTPLFY